MSDEEDNSLKKNNYKYKKTKFYCGNCGKYGHLYKYCNDPITSFGVILVAISSDDNNVIPNIISELKVNEDYPDTIDNEVSIDAEGIIYETIDDIETFGRYKNNIKFLLIQRKHTLGYIEFIRGRYNIENVDGIIFLFKQMTQEEIERIGVLTFDELWDDLWSNNKNKTVYHTEYTHAKYKFGKLKKGTDNNILGLNFYVENVPATWSCPEWGFPKGRRNYQEDNMMCAIREFSEESGFDDSEFILLDKVVPFNEQFIGTNGINYKHIYYLALASTDKLPSVNPDNQNQISEIGAISWCTFEECIKLLRPYHIERRKILTKLYMYLMNSIIRIKNQVKKDKISSKKKINNELQKIT